MQIFLRFWIKKDNKNFLGKGKVELLEHIGATGSILKAAKNMKMSYKAAWDSIDGMNHLAKEPMVQSKSGGKGGGGTVLTAEAQKALAVFKHLECVMDKLQAHLGESQDFDELENKILSLEAKLAPSSIVI
ncbi:LysR family transcriptional regulator [Helicobacter sp. 11S02596-1]|uniref:winged helix-turn-helix domain-containing protein n=1 Tax=Helicobacter sp. 11S02596-1 TaxID=1476194 RepID=UPI000BA5064F|nr:LysR family transcriptional regulator [Helicobacter sp. 11S02596-1]PAF42432.1 hypothetical protein BJI48_06375 [Helicobacter sp. 11S02596-1]